jgi:hypothetical protein
MTVDKRYYHSNSEPGAEQYFEINLKPGYQKLCGLEALEFVANRHESTSLIRDARDQRFLLETKAEYGPSLFGEREKFERIFGKYVQSTLGGEAEILQLLYLLAESAGKPTRQVDFHVNLQPTFDTAGPQQIHEAVASFLGGTTAVKPQALAAPAHAAATHGHHATRAHRSSSPTFALTPTTSSELAEARSQAPNLPFPLNYPRVRDSYAGAEPDELRVYTIHDRHGRPHPIYDIVVSRGHLGQYYDVQGTNWTDPPILGSPGQSVTVGSRTYELFYTGEKVRTIAWREAGAVYWIENTLTNDVSPRVMLAMATQTVPVIRTRFSPPISTSLTPTANVDLAPHTSTSSTATELGALLGFVGLVVVAALAQALALETRQRPLLAAGGFEQSAAASATPEPPPTVYRARRRLKLARGGPHI